MSEITRRDFINGTLMVAGSSMLPSEAIGQSAMVAKGPVRKPRPISWDEQGSLFQQVSPHLERMALFAVNTGLRSGEVCGLRWDWEVRIPEIEDSVFLIPDEVAKNGQERVVVLNRIARGLSRPKKVSILGGSSPTKVVQCSLT